MPAIEIPSVVDAAGLAELPEAMRTGYAQMDDGNYALQVSGVDNLQATAPIKRALDAERAAKRDATAALEQAQNQLSELSDLNPDEARKAIKRLREISDQKLIDAGEIDALLDQRVGTMQQDHAAQIQALQKSIEQLTGERQSLQGQIESVLIDNGLRDVAAKAGAFPFAIDDVLSRLKPGWRVREGQPTAVEGDNARYGREGKPLSMEEDVDALRKQAPHLFPKPTGADLAGGSSRPSNGSGTKIKIAYNDTQSLSRHLADVAAGKVEIVDPR